MKRNIILTWGVFSLLLTPCLAHDLDRPNLSLFESFQEVTIPQIENPTVIEAQLRGEQKHGIAILENNQHQQAWLRLNESEKTSVQVLEHSSMVGEASHLVDDDPETTAEFNLDEDQTKANITLEFEPAISSDHLNLDLARHVALPNSITIQAEEVPGQWKTILKDQEVESVNLSFPETTAKKWRIHMIHQQPLRLREITFNQLKHQEESLETTVRWLARPGETYTLYSDAVAWPDIKTPERGKLIGEDLEVKEVTLSDKRANLLFKEPDIDEDGVPDLRDNCVNTNNSDQKDLNKNGKGDACEDFDGDGIKNAVDNCPSHPNRNQSDQDGDKKGDACDQEESRLTEQYPFLPWVAIGIALIIIIFIVLHTIKKERKSSL